MNSTYKDFDLSKVVSIEFYWRNKEDTIKHSKQPKYFSCNGIIFNAKEYAPHLKGYELETTLERARRLDILDSWTPVIKLKMFSNYPLIFEGLRALKIKAMWDAKIYGKKKKP